MISTKTSAGDCGTTALLLTVTSGVVLLALLPVGILAGTGGVAFTAATILHGILQLGALITTLLFLRARASNPRTAFITAATILVVGAGIGIAGSVPITARDALIHHLAVAKWWVEAGTIHQIPWHEWSYYPMLLDLGFTALIQHGAAWATPYYHATFLVLLAGMVAIFLHRAGREDSECCAGFCIALTIPIAFKLATVPVVDLGLALYVMAALTALLFWTAEGKTKWILLAGTALGLALGTKYNGILACGIIVPLTVIFGIRSGLSQPRTLGGVALLALTAAMFFLPWALKDYLWTGNPIYPLFNGIFHAAAPVSATRGLTPLELRTLLYGESWLDILLTPLRMLVVGVDEDPRRFDGVLTPILLFSLFSFRKESRKPWVLFSALVIVLYFLLAQVYAAPRVRYLAPLYGPLAALTAVGIFEAASLFRSRRALLLTGALAVQALWFGHYLSGVFSQTGAMNYFADKITDQDYYRKHLVEYPMIEFINGSTPENASVYLLYTGNKFYLYNRTVRSAGHNAGNDLILWLRSSTNAEELASKFRSLGVTEIEANIELLSQALATQVTLEQRQLWDSFVSSFLKPKFSSGPFVLWSLS